MGTDVDTYIYMCVYTYIYIYIYVASRSKRKIQADMKANSGPCRLSVLIDKFHILHSYYSL